MECKERLQLVRALYALSQQEMAELVGTGRTFIAAIENGRRSLPEPLAEVLSNKLYIDADWLTDEHWQSPLQGMHLLIVDYPPRKVLAAARNIRALRLNDSISTIKKLWPLFMERYPPQRCWHAEGADDQTTILVLLHATEGILFRLSGVKPLAESLLESIKKSKDVQLNELDFDKEEFDGVVRQLACIRKFLERCGIEGDTQNSFLSAAEHILPAHETQINELSGKTRQSVLEKVCAEIMENDLSMTEIKDILKSCGRNDLIKATSH